MSKIYALVSRSDLKGCLLFHGATDIDNIVGDDAEPDPTVHSDVALVAAAVEAIAPFDHADASLASGAPLLAVAEPALFLLASFGAFSRAADAFDAFRLRCGLVFGGVRYGLAAGCGHLGRLVEDHRQHDNGNAGGK